MKVHLRITAPDVAGVQVLFETLDRGWPSVRSLSFSLATHMLIAWVLATVSFPGSHVRPKPATQLDPTEIRIGDRLYYVSRISPQDTQKTLAHRAPGPRKAAVRKAPRPVPSPVEAAKTNPAPAPRTFIPPEFKRDPIAKQTLIQPDSPPDIHPRNLDLPTFRMWTAEVPKIPKPFVAPGRHIAPVDNPQMLAEPSFNLTRAPRQINLTPRLTLPPPPAPLDLPPAPEIPQINAGDPVNILSIGGRPALPDDLLKVPQGNVVAEDKPGASVSSPTATPLGTTANTPADRVAANSDSQPVVNAGPGNSPTGTKPSQDVKMAGPANAAGTASLSSTGEKAPRDGRMAAENSGAPGSGSTSSGLAPGAGTSADGFIPNVKQTVILRPANGNFDTVVVQSSPLDLFPEGRNLLSGRPVYTVYIAVGTSKDWPLYFCVAGQKPPPSSTVPGIVVLDSPPPVKAPYPTRIVRPGVSLPKYEKYVLVHAILNDGGHFRELRVVNAGDPQTDRAILAAINGWEFRPASQDGVPVPVEILLAIPAAGL